MWGREEGAHLAPGANAVVVADAHTPAVPTLMLPPVVLAVPRLLQVPSPHAVLVRAVPPQSSPHAVHFPVHAVLLEHGGLRHPLHPPSPLHPLPRPAPGRPHHRRPRPPAFRPALLLHIPPPASRLPTVHSREERDGKRHRDVSLRRLPLIEVRLHEPMEQTQLLRGALAGHLSRNCNTTRAALNGVWGGGFC